MVCPLALTGIQNGYVLAAITLLVLPIAAIVFARAGAAWQEIGKGRFGVMHSMPPPRISQPAPADRPGDPGGRGPADAGGEVLPAQATGRGAARRRGRDAPACSTRTRRRKPDLDEKLRAEVRDLVVARNERRMRRGEEPLDVEAEVERQVADFIGLGN